MWDRAAVAGEEEEADADEEPLLTFNPSVNPNSGDKLMRAQQVSGRVEGREGERGGGLRHSIPAGRLRFIEL